jgi:hypothetical protein
MACVCVTSPDHRTRQRVAEPSILGPGPAHRTACGLVTFTTAAPPAQPGPGDEETKDKGMDENQEAALNRVLAEAPPLTPIQIAHFRAVLAPHNPKENNE